MCLFCPGLVLPVFRRRLGNLLASEASARPAVAINQHGASDCDLVAATTTAFRPCKIVCGVGGFHGPLEGFFNDRESSKNMANANVFCSHEDNCSTKDETRNRF